MEAGLGGVIHVVWLLWQQHSQEEDWGFLLIDARNSFNEDNRTDMLWEVRFECPYGARFVFNCYCHWATLVIRVGDGTGHFLFRKEGVNHGDPMDMVVYGLVILPLICELRQAHPGITQLWYFDDTRAGITFERIRRHLYYLMVRGPPRGYFLDPTKSILVVFPWNLPRVESFFQGYGLQIVTGSHYLGGFVETKVVQERWLGEKV